MAHVGQATLKNSELFNSEIQRLLKSSRKATLRTTSSPAKNCKALVCRLQELVTVAAKLDTKIFLEESAEGSELVLRGFEPGPAA
jgi:hypothetical protein